MAKMTDQLPAAANNVHDLITMVGIERDNIRTLQDRLSSLEFAAVPAAEAMAAWKRSIMAKADEGETHLQQVAGNHLCPQNFHPMALLGEVRSIEGTNRVRTKVMEDVLTFFLQDQLLDYGQKYFSLRTDETEVLVVPQSEKSKVKNKIEAEIFTAECREEALVEQINGTGVVFYRRPDASPESVLGIAKGAFVPHDFDPEKLQRLLLAAEGARREVEARRQDFQEAQLSLRKLEVSKSDAVIMGREIEPGLLDDINNATKKVELRRKLMAESQTEISEKVVLAQKLEEYVATHRAPKKGSQGAVRGSRSTADQPHAQEVAATVGVDFLTGQIVRT